MLRNMWFTRALYPNTRSMHTLILSVPSTSSTQGLKVSYFSRLKKHQPSTGEKRGHCEYCGFLGSNPLLNRLGTRAGPPPSLPHEEAHYIKTTREPTKRCSPRTCLGSQVPQLVILPHMGNLLRVNIQKRKIRKVDIYPRIS